MLVYRILNMEVYKLKRIIFKSYLKLKIIKAMENWGLAIYRESNFLHNVNSSQKTEMSVVRVIAHEISHMWFGNLVTPKWYFKI